MCVQNRNFRFDTLLAPVWPYHLKIARCKTTVNLLSYGIGIDLLKGGSQEEMCVQIFGTDRQTDRQTDRRTDRPKSSTLYPSASRGIKIQYDTW